MRLLDSAKKIIILFDIDYTLFDTENFKQSNLKSHIIYPEVKDVLSSLDKIAVLGILSEGDVVFQMKKLKRCKIDNFFSDKHIHIVLQKNSTMYEILDIYKNNRIFIVDDKLSFLREIKLYMPSLFTIWVKRGPYAMNRQSFNDFTPDAAIINLTFINNIIRERTGVN